MKKFLMLITGVLVILTACANTENTDQTSTKDIINQSSQANRADEKLEFKEFNGKIAMLTEDVILKKPYAITLNADGDTAFLEMLVLLRKMM